MKLDRNINADGRGKYALINLRTNQVEWGGEGGGFFVLKLHDRFTARGLRAYADAVWDYAELVKNEDPRQEHELKEYADEVHEVARISENMVDRKIPD